MPKWTKTVQANFLKGELSQSVWGRIDTKIYAQGMRHALNACLRPQGGFRLRPGTRVYEQQLQPSVRFLDFFFSPVEQYLLVINPGQIKFWDCNAQAFVGSTITGMPWQIADMTRIYGISIEGIILICHENFWPMRIVRLSAGSFSASAFPFEFSPDQSQHFCPFYKFAPGPMLIKPLMLGPGHVNLETNAPYWSINHADVSPYGAKMLVRLNYPADPVNDKLAQSFTLTIDSVANNQQISCTLLGTKPLPNLNLIPSWDESLCNPVWGYPRVCGYHDQRIILAGHPAAPGIFTASKPGAPYNFDVGQAADGDAINVVVATESSNQVRGVLSGHHLTIMTSQGPFYFPGSDTNPLTPTTIDFRRTAASQCAWTKPVMYDMASIYVQRRGGHLREMVFDLYRQAYNANSISLNSAHMLSNPIELWVLEPNSIGNANRYLVALNDNGTLAVYLGDRDQEISGWVPWNTNGYVHSICNVGEHFFMAVERDLGFGTYTYLEELDWSEVLDSVTYHTSPSPTTHWINLLHWAGYSPDLIGDGYYMGRYPVSPTGDLHLPQNFACSTLIAGISFGINWETMAVDQMLSDGPKAGRPYTVGSTVLRVENTEALRVRGVRLWPRSPKDPTGLPPPLMNGPKELFLRGWSKGQTITMQLDYPCPVHVISLNVELGL